MKRRTLLLASCAAAALSGTRAWAQPAKPPRRIAFLSPGTRESNKPNFDVFRSALKGLGYVEGRDVVIDIRWSDGVTERLAALAHELLALNPAVLLTVTNIGAEAAKAATSTVPVVFIAVSSPDTLGYVASLGRPGGNMTGTAFRAGFSAKLTEILREVMPAAKRIALLDLEGYSSQARSRAFHQRTFAALGFDLAAVVPVKSAEDFAPAYARITESKAEVVWAVPHALLVAHARRLSELALQLRLPLVGPRRAFAEAGALLSYDNDARDDFRRAAAFVDKILKGARPAELPVEQMDRFQLVVNQRSAKALDIRIPQSVLQRADEVIE